MKTWARAQARADFNYPFLTQKERDNETGLDYFGARYYASTQGRFTGADPISLGIDRLFDPQRFNRYAYVRNNPLAFTDPDGRDIVLGSGDQKRVKQALVEIAKRPGGRELLTKLDKLTIQIIVGTGTVNDSRDYGSVRGVNFTRTVDHDTKKVLDVKGEPLILTLDFKQADKDRDANKAGKEMGIGELKKDVPQSDAQLEGHELAHLEDQLINRGNPNSLDAENVANDRINGILAEPVDKKLAQDAQNFVDNLIKPNQPPPQAQPTPEPKKKPEDE